MVTHDQLKKLFNYRNDGELIWKVDRVSIKVKGRVAGHIDSHGYRKIQIDEKGYKAHRLVWLFHYGYLPENDIDHHDRIKHHNRIENLREVSRSCNMRNTKLRKDNSSGIKGLSWSKQHKKWKAHITIAGKVKFLGHFNDFDEAVLTRFCAEQCLGWFICDISSPAYQYLKIKNLIKF